MARGSPCNDDSKTYPDRPGCNRGLIDLGKSCTAESCSFIRIGLYGWENWTSNGKVSCRVAQHPKGWFGGENGDLNVPFEDNVGWYSEGGFVQIACHGNKFGSPEFFAGAQW